MRYAPLTWYEQEDFRHKAHLELCPEHCDFTSPRVEGWITKILPVCPTGRYTSS